RVSGSPSRIHGFMVTRDYFTLAPGFSGRRRTLCQQNVILAFPNVEMCSNLNIFVVLPLATLRKYALKKQNARLI
ncbi:MAG: hypothetical protein KDD01_12815, partial [Phaeodactylibacter sp.]|nr:hypothetical protein [Phaeodactylibacter sp.]